MSCVAAKIIMVKSDLCFQTTEIKCLHLSREGNTDSYEMRLESYKNGCFLKVYKVRLIIHF